MQPMTQEMLKSEYKDISPGDMATVRLSKDVCIVGCIVLAKTFMLGKVLYTVAVPTGETTSNPECGCLVNANVFIDGRLYVRWENLDSVFVIE